MTRPYCPGCGEQKRIRWYGFCTKDCAAGWAVNQYNAGAQEIYCVICGDFDCPRHRP